MTDQSRKYWRGGNELLLSVIKAGLDCIGNILITDCRLCVSQYNLKQEMERLQDSALIIRVIIKPAAHLVGGNFYEITFIKDILVAKIWGINFRFTFFKSTIFKSTII